MEHDGSPTKWVDIKTLKLWERNPNEGDIGKIMHSISTHGFNDTCHLWRGIVKAGNHSIMALTNLRADGWHPDKCKIPSGCLRVENGTWQVAMLDISEMDDLQSDAFGLAINHIQRSGIDDPVALAELLQEFANSDEIAIGSSSFNADDLDELLADLGDRVFDTNQLPDIPEGDLNDAHLLYVTFKTRDDLSRALKILTYGERNGFIAHEGARKSQIDGDKFIDRWDNGFG